MAKTLQKMGNRSQNRTKRPRNEMGELRKRYQRVCRFSIVPLKRVKKIYEGVLRTRFANVSKFKVRISRIVKLTRGSLFLLCTQALRCNKDSVPFFVLCCCSALAMADQTPMLWQIKLRCRNLPPLHHNRMRLSSSCLLTPSFIPPPSFISPCVKMQQHSPLRLELALAPT